MSPSSVTGLIYKYIDTLYFFFFFAFGLLWSKLAHPSCFFCFLSLSYSSVSPTVLSIHLWISSFISKIFILTFDLLQAERFFLTLVFFPFFFSLSPAKNIYYIYIFMYILFYVYYYHFFIYFLFFLVRNKLRIIQNLIFIGKLFKERKIENFFYLKMILQNVTFLQKSFWK